MYVYVYVYVFRNRFWNLTCFGCHSFCNVLADSIHELADGPHGLDAREPDLSWNEGHGGFRVHERKIRDFSHFFGSSDLYFWSILWNDEHHFADGSVDAKKSQQTRLIDAAFQLWVLNPWADLCIVT